jgi:flagellar protein FliS
MTNSLMHAAGAYAQVGLETGIAAASPHKLIEMLFDAALGHLAQARDALRTGEIARRGQAVSRAIGIVDDGLRASLDPAVGGAIAQQLDALYEYIVARLVIANAKSDVAALDEASRLLAELRATWHGIAPAAAAVQPVGARLAA